MSYHPFFAFGPILFGFVLMVAFAAIVIAVAVGATSRHQMPPPMGMTPGAPPPPPPSYPPAGRETPLDILARRFASGEITAEEYQRGRDLLQGGSNPPPS